MMSLAKIDVMSIEWFWEMYFSFQDSGPLSKKFALAGMDSYNFLYNSGSMIPNILSGQGSSIFFFVVIVVFRKRLRNKWIL
jgi:hypothetical protein